MMGFFTGASCFLHSPLYHFPASSLPPPSPPSSSCRSRNVRTKTKFRGIRAPMACSPQDEDPNEGAFCNKRTVLFTDIPFLPLLGLRAKALEGLAIKESEVKTPEFNQNYEIAPNKSRSSYLFLSLLNGRFVTISSVVLGAVSGFVVAQKERAAANATIETMNRKLKAQEELISSFRKNFGAMLLIQKEQIRQLGRATDEQNALINQLNSANSTITFIEQELQSKQNLIEELKLQIDGLETQLAMADAEKKNVERSLEEKIDSVEILEERYYLLSLELKDKRHFVQNLTSSIAEKESEIRSLNSYYKQTKDELSNSHLQIQGLKDELLKSQEELEAKDSSVNDFYTSVKSLTLQNNDFRREFSVMEEKYNNLKSTADKKAASDAKLVREKEEELHQLEEKFEHALNEASRNQVIIAQLTQEREILNDSLDSESKKANHLKSELQITQENLGKSRNEAAQLERHINELHKLQKELEVEVSNLSAEHFEVTGSLQKGIDDEKLKIQMLTSELRTAKEDSKKSHIELQRMSHEQTGAIEKCSSLQKELVDVYKKAETAAKDLNEEKMLVASLKKDVQALESQVFKDQEARRALKLKLEEATRIRDEMNQNALILSGQLKRFNSRILNLEDDREVLQKLLTDQKNASKQTQKNIEDAQNHIKRLGMEREKLESKEKKLEEELASARGEILRLRSQKISSSKVVTNKQLQKYGGESEVTVNVEKNVTQEKKG